jgi:hypothetical protein
VVDSVEPLGIDPIEVSHRSGQPALRRLNQKVIVLCEAPNYVK